MHCGQQLKEAPRKSLPKQREPGQYAVLAIALLVVGIATTLIIADLGDRDEQDEPTPAGSATATVVDAIAPAPEEPISIGQEEPGDTPDSEPTQPTPDSGVTAGPSELIREGQPADTSGSDLLSPGQSVQRKPAITEIQLEDLELAVLANLLLSPDGSKIAYADSDQLCVFTISGKKQRCISIKDMRPDIDSFSWSPDSDAIMFTESSMIYRIDSDVWLLHTNDFSLENITDDGYSGEARRSFPIDYSPVWIDEGSAVAFLRFGEGDGYQSVYTIDLSSGTITDLLHIPLTADRIKQSPDRSLFAFLDYLPGQDGVYLRNVGEEKNILLLEGGYGGLEFSADGRYVVALPVKDDSPIKIVPVFAGADDPITLLNPESFPIDGFGWFMNEAGFIFYSEGVGLGSTLFAAEQPGAPFKTLFRNSYLRQPVAYPFRLIPIAQNNTFLMYATIAGDPKLKLILFDLGESRSPKTPAANFVGYDLNPAVSSNGWITYSLKVAIQNDLNQVILIPPVNVTDAYVETEEGEIYPAELNRVLWPTRDSRQVYPAGNITLSCNDGWSLLDAKTIVMEMICLRSPFGREIMEHWSWEITFRIPETVEPIKLLIPDLTTIDLHNLPLRADLGFDEANDPETRPIYFETGNVSYRLSNPRFINPDLHHRQLAVDIQIINKDQAYERDIMYQFQVVDPYGISYGAWESHTICGNDDPENPLPTVVGKIGPGQTVAGTICIDLQNRYWDTVSVLDPSEMGLDSTGLMEVMGVQATFEQLREGVETPDGQRLVWIGNRRLGRIEVQEGISVQQEPRPGMGDFYFVTIVVDNQGIDQAFRLRDIE